MNSQHIINNSQRLYVLSHLVSQDSRSLPGKVSLIVRNLREQEPDTTTEPSIRKMIDALEILEFGPPESGDSATPCTPDETDDTDDTDDHSNILQSEIKPDQIALEEVSQVVRSRIAAHILNLSKRARFDLWVGVQADIPERSELAGRPLRQIMLSIKAEFTPTEKNVFDSLIDIITVRNWCRSYFSQLTERLTGTPEFHSLTPSANVSTHSGDGQSLVTTTSERPTPAKLTRSNPFSFKRSLFYGLIIVIGAYAANWIYLAGIPAPPERDMVRMSIQAVDRFDINAIDFSTTSLEQAERFISERMDIQARSPEISSATLRGVDIIDLPSEMSAPALIYRDELSGKIFPVFIYSYSFIQKNSRNVDVSPQIMHRIEDASKFGVMMTDEYSALIWRHRDDIFIAVVKSNPDDLVERIAIL